MSHPSFARRYQRRSCRPPRKHAHRHQVENDIATFARLGVSETVFDFRNERLAESLERIERFASVIRETARV